MWSTETIVNRTSLMESLHSNSRFGPNTKITLAYPGCGLDYTSFWTAADPDNIIMFDPAPAYFRETFKIGLAYWQETFITTLIEDSRPDIQHVAFDYDRSIVRPWNEADWRNIWLEGYDIKGTVRPAFSSKFRFRGKMRSLIFVATRWEEYSELAKFQAAANVPIHTKLPHCVNILYEHKSNISMDEMVVPVHEAGCFIWGLPDSAPTVQWRVR